MSTSTRAVIYTRLSEDKKKTGDNVADQKAAAYRLADQLGLTVVDDSYCDNSISASRPNVVRQEFERLLGDAAAGKFDAVIVRHVDRLYRMPADQLRVSQIFGPRGVVIHQEWAGYPIDLSTPTGVLNAGIAAQVALYEISHKAERQKVFYDRILAEGRPKPGGARAFGFEADGVTHREAEAELIRAATRHVLEGGSIGSVVRQWNALGIPATRGGLWGYTSIRALLMRWSNAGIRQRTVKGTTGKKTVVEHGMGTWAPIVPEEEFRALRAKLEDPGRVRHRGDVGRRHLLSHILTCGKCGQPMRAGATTTRAGVRHVSYQCPGLKSRCRLAVDYEAATEAVTDHVVERIALGGADLVEATVEERRRVAALQRRLAEIESDEIVVEQGPASVASKQRQLGELREERDRTQETLSRLTRRMALGSLLLDKLAVFQERNGKKTLSLEAAVEARRQARERFDALDLDRQREIIRLLLTVRVEPALPGVRPTKQTARQRIKVTPLDPRTGEELLIGRDEEAAVS